jgi:hypothetical protein
METVDVVFNIVEKTLVDLVFLKYAEIGEYFLIHPEKDECGLALIGKELEEYKILTKKFDDSIMEKLLNKKSGKDKIINLTHNEIRSLLNMIFWVKDLMGQSAKEKKDNNINIDDDKIVLNNLIELENKINDIMKENGIDE